MRNAARFRAQGTIRTTREWMPGLPAGGSWPNLFIIGAAKSGTTSLHHYLSVHPSIFMCEPKEPQYFVNTPWMPKDPDWYRGLFRQAGDAVYRGESSPFYTMLPIHEGVPERIARVSADARFIYLMRDPIKRLISHYWFLVSLVRKHRSFWDMIEDEPEYVAYSDYETQLRPYVETFGRDRVHALTFESLVSDPARSVRDITDWLGLPPVECGNLDGAWNVTPATMRQPRFGGLFETVRGSTLWGAVAPFVPKILRRSLRRLTERETGPNSLDVEEVVAALRPRFAPMVESLRTFLGRDFPEWTTVQPPSPSTEAHNHEGGVPSYASRTLGRDARQ